MVFRGRVLLAALVCTVALPGRADAAVAPIVPFQPNVGAGGRTVAVDVSVWDGSDIAAAETGGLFRSTDGGGTWQHLDSLPPFMLMDARLSPAQSGVIVATALSDASVPS